MEKPYRIANAIADEMVLDKDLKIALANGSIEPDKRPDLAFWTSRNGHHFRLGQRIIPLLPEL